MAADPIELLNYRKDGSEFWVELHITPVADDIGWYRYWVSVQRETDERRHFDGQRRLYELILANVNDGIWWPTRCAPISRSNSPTPVSRA